MLSRLSLSCARSVIVILVVVLLVREELQDAGFLHENETDDEDESRALNS